MVILLVEVFQIVKVLIVYWIVIFDHLGYLIMGDLLRKGNLIENNQMIMKMLLNIKVVVDLID